MKKKLTSIILVLLSLILIVLGLVVPNQMEEKAISYNYSKNSNITQCVFKITVTAGKQYNMQKATIVLNNNFDDELVLDVLASGIKETVNDKNYIYTFETVITKEAHQYYIIYDVESLTLLTDSGEIDVKYDIQPNNASSDFMRISMFVLAAMLIVSSVIFLVAKRTHEKHEQRKEEQFIVEEIDSYENYNSVSTYQTKPIERYRTCEYCGTDNDVHLKKCEGCGAKLPKK